VSAVGERLTPEQRAAAVEALAVLRRSAAVWGRRAALSHVHAARGVLWDGGLHIEPYAAPWASGRRLRARLALYLRALLRAEART
jgi:hypothetical protein